MSPPNPAALRLQAAALRRRAAGAPPDWVAAAAVSRWRESVRDVADEVDRCADAADPELQENLKTEGV
jgi:phage terminase small subunit